MRILKGGRTPFRKEIISARFALVFVFLLGLDHYVIDRQTIVERAVLGGFDTAAERIEILEADLTVVVGIAATDVDRHFQGHRPLPPRDVLRTVRTLLRHRPAVLVVDVFTDDTMYASPRLSAELPTSQSLVWAAAVDTGSSEVFSVLGGVANPPGRIGLASLIADEDQLVRKLRLRFEAPDAVGGVLESLPLAAVRACPDSTPGCALHAAIPGDTTSVALRTYRRRPAQYVLSDVLAAQVPGMNSKSALTGKIVVLGFIDGSDQVLTRVGAISGPQLIADAIETLVDKEGPIQRLPLKWELISKLFIAVLVTALHHFFVPRLASGLTLGLLVALFPIGIWLHRFGYWANYVGMALGFWIDQLYQGVTANPQSASGPPAPVGLPPPATTGAG